MKDNSVTIGINASFIRKPKTGIGQVTINFLKDLARQVSDSSDNPAKSFRIRGKKVNFILYLEEDTPVDLSFFNIFKKRIFLPPWKRDDLIRKIWWEKNLLPKRVQKDNCNVFISMYQCPTILDSGIKHIMIVHDIIPKLFPQYLNNSRKKIYWKLTEKGICHAEKIIAVSKRTEKDLVQKMKISEKIITTSYLDVDEMFKKEIAEETSLQVLKKYNLGSGYIFSGGGMEIRKNIQGVLRAYKYLVDSNKKEKFIQEMPKLVIYGKLLPQLAPLTTDVEKLAKELNIEKRIILLGSTPEEDMPTLFKNSLMFVYPSHYEGFGIPPLEAMNLGIPVIISNKSSLPEVGGDSVLYCQPDDISDIASVMKNILLNSNLRETLSRRAKERSGQFSWNKFTNKILNIIENL